MFSIQQRCVKSAFTTGAPGGTRGALIMYESSDMIGWKSDQSLSSAVSYWMRLEPTMSSTTLDFEISLDRKVCGACRFLPSLLPGWLYETIAVGLMPADTRKSTITDFILVCPDLKSSPPIMTLCFSASSMTPGTKVFCGEPLMYIDPSSTEATAKMVDGEISGSLSSMACSRLSAVSFTPDCSDAKRSVLAVHSTMTLSSLFAALKSRMSLRI